MNSTPSGHPGDRSRDDNERRPTFPEPSDVIAPRDDLPYDTADFLGEMFMGAYPAGVTLRYHNLLQHSQHYEDDPRMWEVHIIKDENEIHIETLNLEAFRTVTELQNLLDEIVAYDPDDRLEWVSHR